jgi:hypothetical protein
MLHSDKARQNIFCSDITQHIEAVRFLTLKNEKVHLCILSFHAAQRFVTFEHSGVATGYGPDGRGVGVRVQEGTRFFSSPRRRDRFWSLPSLLHNSYRRIFPWGQSGRVVKLTTHLQLVPRKTILGSVHSLFHTPSWRSA